MKQAINFRKARSVLVKNGYSLDRIRGSHYMYKKEGRTVVINLKLNDCVWQRICKENKIKEC